MRKFIVALVVLIAAAAPAAAQQRLNLDFPGLSDRAEEVVDVTLDANMLRLASKFFSKGEEREIGEMVAGLEGIFVRSYSFAKEGEYDRNLVDKVKSQLGSNWQPLVTVRSKTKENVNIYADMRGDRILGLVIIASEPKEFTVVNIVGPVDIEKLSRLEGQFGIPHVMKEKGRD